jgi:hypothetical protein
MAVPTAFSKTAVSERTVTTAVSEKLFATILANTLEMVYATTVPGVVNMTLASKDPTARIVGFAKAQ